MQYDTNGYWLSADAPVKFVARFGIETWFRMLVGASNLVDNTTYHDTLKAAVCGATNACEVLLRVGAQPDSNHAPNRPVLVAPDNGVQLTDVRNQWLEWQTTNDPDGDAVTYDVAMGYFGENAEPCLLVTNLAASSNLAWSVEVDGQQRLEAGMVYWWQVAARDSAGAATISEGRLFITPPPLMVWIDSPGNGEALTVWDTVVLEASVTNGTAPYTATFYTNEWDAAYGQAGEVQTEPPYRATLGAMTAGWYNVYAVVADSAGWTSMSAVTRFYIQDVGTEPQAGDVEQLAIGQSGGYGRVTLTWSNNLVKVLACTNRYYSINPADWFVLADGVAAPWMHEDATNFASVYYRIVCGAYTSAYDVGKFDVDIEAGSIAWIAFPFTPQEGWRLSDWFGEQLEARNYLDNAYPTLQVQDGIGGAIITRSYYVNTTGASDLGWFPSDDLIRQNAGYILFLGHDHSAIKLTSLGIVPTNSVTINVPYETIPWVGLSYPSSVDMRDSGIVNLFTPPQKYSLHTYDYIDSQENPGGQMCYAEYYIDDWGGGTTNFITSVAGADRINGGNGYIVSFSTARYGTGTWNFMKPY